MAMVRRNMRRYDEDAETPRFKECLGSVVNADGKRVNCNYATAKMTEIVCPRCGGDLVRAY